MIRLAMLLVALTFIRDAIPFVIAFVGDVIAWGPAVGLGISFVFMLAVGMKDVVKSGVGLVKTGTSESLAKFKREGESTVVLTGGIFAGLLVALLWGGVVSHRGQIMYSVAPNVAEWFEMDKVTVSSKNLLTGKPACVDKTAASKAATHNGK